MLFDISENISASASGKSTNSAFTEQQVKHELHDPLRIGVVSHLFASCEHAIYLQQLTEAVAALGQHVIKIEIDTSTYSVGDVFRTLQGAEIWQQHGSWIEAEKPFIASDIQQRLDMCKTITAQQVSAAKHQRSAFDNYIDNALESFDAIIIPTTPGYAPLLSTPASQLADYRNQLLTLTAIAGLTGRPQLHVPFSAIKQIEAPLPCGFSLLGKKNEDMRLMDIAHTLIEQLNQANIIHV